VAKHLARATQEPGVVREVDDAELLDLHRWGILHSYEHTDEASAALGGHVKTPGKWASPKKGEEPISSDPAMTEADIAALDKKEA
jgi:hypothetical protein